MGNTYDAGVLLIPAGAITNSQSFAALPLIPRDLMTSTWVVNVTVPPVASATFVLEQATTSAFATPTTLATLVFPAGVSGSKQMPAGVSGSVSAIQNQLASWVRVTVTTTGALTASSWLTKASDGSFGLGQRANDQLTVYP